jgi:hypothetical protein
LTVDPCFSEGGETINSGVQKAAKDLLTEIITRKDGGSKGGASHKAHMSYYNHMRRMKKKNHSMNLDHSLGFGMHKKEQDNLMINSDLDCVMVEEVSRASSAINRKRLELRSRSEVVDPINPRQKTEKT